MRKLIKSIQQADTKIGSKILIYDHQDFENQIPKQAELESNGNIFEVKELFIDRNKLVALEYFDRSSMTLIKYLEFSDLLTKKYWLYE